MSKKKAWLLTIVLLTALLPAFPAWAEAEKPAKWTVMFYLCGSDLESRHGYATQNLEQIEKCMSYDHVWNMLRGLFPSEGEVWPASVNVVIETGGSKRWHAQELGMDVATDRLQRWRYAPYAGNGSDGSSAFALEADIPLASMADPETLADFIRWGAEDYPAEKYALVLWDHGDGSKTGIFIDELFDGDTLYLDELHDALAGGGVNFEAVVFDACLMANIETAHAIKDNARWMIASEEVVAGKGTAIGDWLQQLFYAPQWDGERLGRWICDMTETKYASDGNDQARDILTWSVIDLSKIETLATQFDSFFESVGRCYATDPAMMVYNAYFLTEAFEFGFGETNMVDLSELFYHSFIIGSLELDVYYDVLDALAEAVVYNARGTSRSGTGGLSFCYAADFTRAEMDVYARNCPFPHYLAFLDAIMPTWTAPEWVYQAVDRLPDMQDIEDYRLRVNKWIGDDNIPGYTITEGLANVRGGALSISIAWMKRRAWRCAWAACPPSR